MYPPLQFADLDWDENGQPISRQFGDVYFSKANGLQESRHVFLAGNNLPERWRNAAAQNDENNSFVIAETGFGSGLNFLAAWKLWDSIGRSQQQKLRNQKSQRQLHFISIEAYPLAIDDLRRCLALWPELKAYAEELIAVYPVAPLRGFHRLVLAEGRVRLTLIIDDVAEALKKLCASQHPEFMQGATGAVDAWFLDGFAPGKNPGMWQADVLQSIARLSKVGSTLATFTVAGDVRRGLQAVGFETEKSAGFGHKREMLRARFSGISSATAKTDETKPQITRASGLNSPWFVTPAFKPQKREALVIGAGLAGCHSAFALAQRGWRVRVLDKHQDIAEEASGNAQAVLYGKLSPDDGNQGQFNFSCLAYAQRFYRTYFDSARQQGWGESCGVLYLAHSEATKKIQNQLQGIFGEDLSFIRFVSKDEASKLAGLELSYGGMFVADSGWLQPKRLCRKLLAHPNIEFIGNVEVVSLSYDDEQKRWRASGQQSPIADAPLCIIANAQGYKTFTQTDYFPLRSIRGQVSYLGPAMALKDLRAVVCAEGYIAPFSTDSQNQSLGATFTLQDMERAVKVEDHRSNVESSARAIPAANALLEAGLENLQGRTAFRCTSPDYLPLLGPVPDRAAFLKDYEHLRKNAQAVIRRPGTYLPGLYINVAHGSRGLAYTPLCAELLAAQINGEPLPTSANLAAALNPARFLIRELIRGR